MYSYDRRSAKVVTANMSLQDFYWGQWQKVLAQKRKLEATASKNTLKEAKHFLSELGFDLDLTKSSIETERSGSDSWMHSVYLVLNDTMHAERGDKLTPDFVGRIVFDACRFQPRAGEVKQTSPGVWTIQHGWGG